MLLLLSMGNLNKSNSRYLLLQWSLTSVQVGVKTRHLHGRITVGGGMRMRIRLSWLSAIEHKTVSRNNKSRKHNSMPTAIACC